MSDAVLGMLDLETLEREIAEGTIDTVITALPDLYGRLVGKRIHGRFFLEEVVSDGMHVCNYLLACDMEMDPTPGYAFTSWEKGYGDLHAVPDLGTLRRAAWHPRTALVLCDAHDEDSGEPIALAPRQLLKRQLERGAAMGLHPCMASELELFLFRDDYRAAQAKGWRDLEQSQHYVEDYHVLSSSFAEDVIGSIRREVDASGVPVEFSKGEWGPGQHEINLRYTRALEMADRHVVYKLAAKEIAARHGASVTFMAKLHEDLAGSSLHIHMSLVDDEGHPQFPGVEPLPGTQAHSSETFRFFLGGLLAHVRELSLFLAPTVNSYKRYQPGTFAPTGIAWSWDNRTAGFRVVGGGPSLRVECRVPGADANPYLAYAALFAAGLEGVEQRIEPPPAFEGDVYQAENLPQVPRDLSAAIDALDGSRFARATFGDAVVDHYLHFARTELVAVERRVTDVERARYFERI